MDRRRLLSFIALAEELHFERAAARSHITQSAMSQQLRQLEDQVGALLVYRTKRHVSLTQAGEVFLGEARRIIAQMDGAALRTRQVERGEMGELTIGVTAPALYIVLPEIVARFAKKAPHVRLVTHEMTTDEQESALRSGEIQVGILHPPLVDESLACREIAHTAFDIVLSSRNSLADLPQLTLKDLAREQFILFPRRIGPRLYDNILALCIKAGFSPSVIREAYPAQSIVALAACNFGVGFIASEVQHFNRPLVVFRRLADVSPQITLGVAYRREERSPLVRTFEKAAIEAARSVR